ncbi:Arm DNA-binding domain-containing protein [Abiotrophia defectiva]
MDDLGVRRYKTKRGFKTKREAMAFEQEYKKKVSGASDMTFESFV